MHRNIKYQRIPIVSTRLKAHFRGSLLLEEFCHFKFRWVWQHNHLEITVSNIVCDVVIFSMVFKTISIILYVGNSRPLNSCFVNMSNVIPLPSRIASIWELKAENILWKLTSQPKRSKVSYKALYLIDLRFTKLTKITIWCLKRR